MIAVRLEDALVKEIDMLAKVRDTNRSMLIREAITRFLEDQEDTLLAKKARLQSKSAKSLIQLRKELGLDR